MNCNEACDYMMKYLDGELDNSEYVKLIHHINKCSRCCAEFQEYNNIIKVLEEDKGIEPPDDFEMAVMNRITLLESNKKSRIEKKFLAFCFLSGIFILIGLTVCSVFLKEYILEIMRYMGMPAGISYAVYGMLSNFAYKVKMLIRFIYCFNSIFRDIYYIFMGLLVIAAISKVYKTKEIENKSGKPANILSNE